MIKEVKEKDISECVRVIRDSFATVADEFGFTAENAPKFTAFATTEDRLKWHLFGEHRPMYAYYDNGTIVGYYSLLLQDNSECELNNLCVLPAYRHRKIGQELLIHAFISAKELGCSKVNIGIVEENKVLKNGMRHLGSYILEPENLIFFLLPVDIWRENYLNCSRLSHTLTQQRSNHADMHPKS